MTAAHEDGHGQNARDGGAVSGGAGQEAIASKQADKQADDGTQKDGLTKDAELLLHRTNVDVDLVQARNLVDNPVDGEGDRSVSTGEAVRDGDAGEAEGLLDQRSGQVADDEDDNLVDDSGGDTKSDVVGNDGNESAGEGEVPVVPDIDVSGLGGVGEQHEHVHEQAQRNDDGAHDGSPWRLRKPQASPRP